MKLILLISVTYLKTTSMYNSVESFAFLVDNVVDVGDLITYQFRINIPNYLKTHNAPDFFSKDFILNVRFSKKHTHCPIS
jgi:hypothetical protein